MRTNRLLELFVLYTVLLLPVCGRTQETFNIGDIETILEDNMLNEVSNRYLSVISSLLPEEATRLGYNSGDDKLNLRTPQQHTKTVDALLSVHKSLEKVDEKKLSAAKKTERQMMLSALNTAILQKKQEQNLQNPLYYTQALDAVHDLLTKQLSSPLRQKLDLLARLSALPTVAEEAETNLTTVNPVLAQRAMEKAYYAFLSLNEWNQLLLEGVTDTETRTQVTHITQEAKKATKKLFDLFRRLSQQPTEQDFRLGQNDYFTWLQQHYQVTQKPALLLGKLNKNLQRSQTGLTQALDPFLLTAEETNEVTVVDENNPTSTEPLRETTKRLKSRSGQLRNAQDFYAAAKTFMMAKVDPEPLETLRKDAQAALFFFIDEGVLPAKNITFHIAQLPQYYVLSTPYLFVPPFANQLTPRSDFFLRVPTGNALNQQTLFDQDFNTPTRKLMISGQLVPGRYYQAESSTQAPLLRRLYPSASLINGWEAYAKRLAQKHNYLNTEEDLLVLAWDEYLHALAAYTDAQLHTQQFSYEDALEFLTQTHGLDQTQAETMLRDIAANPGEAVSYFIGLEALENAYRKYSKKFGKKFDEADFHARLFRLGNVPPAYLDKELARSYKQDKKK